MSDAVRGVIVAHGDLAAALVRTVERISGLEGPLRAVSNEGLGAEELRARLMEEAAGRPTIFFVDLETGSCGTAGLGVSLHAPEVAVLTGANVPMLLDFVFNRELPIGDLAERLQEKARAGIRAHGCVAPSGGKEG